METCQAKDGLFTVSVVHLDGSCTECQVPSGVTISEFKSQLGISTLGTASLVIGNTLLEPGTKTLLDCGVCPNEVITIVMSVPWPAGRWSRTLAGAALIIGRETFDFLGDGSVSYEKFELFDRGEGEERLTQEKGTWQVDEGSCLRITCGASDEGVVFVQADFERSYTKEEV